MCCLSSRPGQLRRQRRARCCIDASHPAARPAQEDRAPLPRRSMRAARFSDYATRTHHGVGLARGWPPGAGVSGWGATRSRCRFGPCDVSLPRIAAPNPTIPTSRPAGQRASTHARRRPRPYRRRVAQFGRTPAGGTELGGRLVAQGKDARISRRVQDRLRPGAQARETHGDVKHRAAGKDARVPAQAGEGDWISRPLLSRPDLAAIMEPASRPLPGRVGQDLGQGITTPRRLMPARGGGSARTSVV